MSSSVEDDGPVLERSTAANDDNVITAEQFEAAALASGRTMIERGVMLGVSRGSVHAYRRNGITKPAIVEKVRRVMGVWLRDEKGDPFVNYTDDDLVAEIQRRLRRVQEVLSQTADKDGREPDVIQDTPASRGEAGRYTGSGGPA